MSYDLREYSCPMNLVMAKNYFFELTEGKKDSFILNASNTAGIENICEFLKFKNSKYGIKKYQDRVIVFFTKNVNDDSAKSLKQSPNTNLKIKAKKTELAKTLKQNINRRKQSTKIIDTN
jgi:TusA-related sulfurtransferase